MKKNKKWLDSQGFAISGILYSIFILMLILIMGSLQILQNRKISIDKIKNDTVNNLNLAGSYLLQYDLNIDGSSLCPEQVVVYPSTYEVLCQPQKEGYEFVGWYDSEENDSGKGNLISETSNVIVASNHTLYAKWTSIKFNVLLDNQGATTPGDLFVRVNYNNDLPKINIPTKQGYVFGGYYTGKNGSGTKYINADGTSANKWLEQKNNVLYALWVERPTIVASMFNEYPKSTGVNVGVNAFYLSDATVPRIREIDLFDENGNEIAWSSSWYYSHLYTSKGKISWSNVNLLKDGSLASSVAGANEGRNVIVINIGYEAQIQKVVVYPHQSSTYYENYINVKLASPFSSSTITSTQFDSLVSFSGLTLKSGSQTFTFSSTPAIRVTAFSVESGIKEIYYGTSANNMQPVGLAPGETTYELTGLTGTGRYYFKAVDNSGNESEIIEVSY